MKKISVTIITLNEEKDLVRALESVKWADEIIVVDSGSTDKTIEIAKSYTENVEHRNWTGFVDQKNFAVSLAKNNWIFSIDADEECSNELMNEILRWKKDYTFSEVAYRIPRMSYFLGSWIKHTNWYPNYQIRLFDKRKAHWSGGKVHEGVSAQGKIGAFRGHLYHYTYEDLSDFLKKMQRYSSLGAEEMHHKGKKANLSRLLISPWIAFIKSYVLKKGFLCGRVGAIVAGLTFMSRFYKYAKLYELALNNEQKDESQIIEQNSLR